MLRINYQTFTDLLITVSNTLTSIGRAAFLCLALLFSSLVTSQENQGFQLDTSQFGTWGQPSVEINNDILDAFAQSGLDHLLLAASLELESVAQNGVPSLNELKNLSNGNPQQQAELVLAQISRMHELFKEVNLVPLKNLLDKALQGNTEKTFAITHPVGRIVFKFKPVDPTNPLEKSLLNICAMYAGPAGTRLTLGLGNGNQLCDNPAKRFYNPTRGDTLFMDIALDTAHIQMRSPLSVNDILGPSIEAAGYVKLAENHWTQLRIAGSDPESLTVDVMATLGLKAGVQAKLQAEVEGTGSLGFSVKPLQAFILVDEIRTILETHLDPLNPQTSLSPEFAALAFIEILNHIRSRGGAPEDEIGRVFLEFAVDASVGVGVLDTGINLASIGGAAKLDLPLDAALDLTADRISELLLYSMDMAELSRKIMSQLAEGKIVENIDNNMAEVATIVGGKISSDLLDYIEAFEGINYNQVLGLYLFGDIGQAAGQTVPVFEFQFDVPLGKMVADGIIAGNKTQVIAETYQGAIKMVSSIASHALAMNVDPQTGTSLLSDFNDNVRFAYDTAVAFRDPLVPLWGEMANAVLDPVTVSFELMMIPQTLTRLAVEDISVGHFSRAMFQGYDLSNLILDKAFKAVSQQDVSILLNFFRDDLVNELKQDALEQLVFFLQTVKVAARTGIGASGTVGAEVAAGIGGSIAFETEFKLSPILLAFSKENYNEKPNTDLFKFDIPVTLSGSGGVSLGEAVEFMAEGGFEVGKSLFGVTWKEWGDNLPASAGLTVAGFEVLFFDGYVDPISGYTIGEGWLVLPMGGLVKASFTLDASGRVVTGTWSGMMELGPIATLTFFTGVLDNDGLRGQTNVAIAGSSFNVDFLLRSDGLLFGHLMGNLTVNNYTLAALDLHLTPNGTFAGSGLLRFGQHSIDSMIDLRIDNQLYAKIYGDVNLGGVQSTVDFTLDNTGLNGTADVEIFGQMVQFDIVTKADLSITGTGTSSFIAPWGFGFDANWQLVSDGNSTDIVGQGTTTILGSTFTSQQLKISSGNEPIAKFSGTLNIAGQQLSISELSYQNNLLRGFTELAIGDQPAVQVEITVANTQVTGRLLSDLVLYGMPHANVELIFSDKIYIRSLITGEIIGSLEDAIRASVLASLEGALLIISEANKTIDELEKKIAELDVKIVDRKAQVVKEREEAIKALHDAEEIAQATLNELNKVLQDMAQVRLAFASQLNIAINASRLAQSGLSAAQREVNRIRDAIAALDNWYSRLSDWDKFWSRGAYLVARGSLVEALKVANGVLATAQSTLSIANATLAEVQRQIENELGPLRVIKEAREIALTAASLAVTNARNTLLAIASDPNNDVIVIGLVTERTVALGVISTTRLLLKTTSETVGAAQWLFDYVDQNIDDLSNFVEITRVQMDSTLDRVTVGTVMVQIDFRIGGVARSIRTEIDLRYPQVSLQKLLDEASELAVPELHPEPLEEGEEPETGWNDNLPPTSFAAVPGGWSNQDVAIVVTAFDSESGVASISYAVSGANAKALTVVSGTTATIALTQSGESVITWFATDYAGNVEDEQTAVISIDKTGPVATINAQSEWTNQPVEVSLHATDDFSGVQSLNINTQGAFVSGAFNQSGDSGSISIFTEGETRVQLSATDNAGNTGATVESTIRIDRTEPELNIEAPEGWSMANAGIVFDASDALSGVASIMVRAEGAGAFSSVALTGDRLNIDSEGVTTIYAYATDKAGNQSSEKSVTVYIDRTPPSVTLSAADSWQNSAVSVAIDAQDNAGGSGMQWLEVIATIGDSSLNYMVDGTTTQLPVTAEGITSITIVPVDAAGNRGAPASVVVKIDLTKPDITFDGDRNYDVAEQVVVGCSAVDNLSGLAANDCANSPLVNAPAYTFLVGTHPVSASATDLAGNRTDAASEFEVSVSFSGMSALIQRFVSHPGTQNSLTAKLNAAQRGNGQSHANNLRALIRELEALRGKSHISDEHANVLIRLTKNLIDAAP
ncbi:hypothetical protein P2G88_02225 [Aliiglaciecola sp. CAU 1673]|uniref:OmpL47-type beta-barrel domain-containing protein n=1 Tax=Aliiglaciecola sp. CAU 1673 TaxID=3032595 RepID=UPI0023DB9A93|nr:hypothetical protein [Aliiglaciecola sp. CAU 1673]MDF2177067.1 hypothetical protein [Aliiglaciecola sp. CAU 1673]